MHEIIIKINLIDSDIALANASIEMKILVFQKSEQVDVILFLLLVYGLYSPCFHD